MTAQWHVAYCDARCEQETARDIQADTGFPAYCPTERHKRFRRGVKTIVESALFPRYLFVCFDADGRWPAILEVDGVCDVLRNNGHPSPVPDAIVPKLKRMEHMGLFDYTKAPNPYPPNSWARTDEDGPFADVLVKICRVRSGDRVEAMLNYLGREIMVNLPMARLSHI